MWFRYGFAYSTTITLAQNPPQKNTDFHPFPRVISLLKIRKYQEFEEFDRILPPSLRYTSNCKKSRWLYIKKF